MTFMIWNKTRQGGFTLVETMVAMALLSVAVTLGMNFIGGATKSRKNRSIQSMQRYIAIQVTQHITGNLAMYPPIVHPASKKIVYVGCMTKEGILIGNKYSFRSLSISTFNEKNPTGLCPADKTAYEARFFWTEAGIVNGIDLSDEVKINLLTLETGTNKSLAVHNFYIFAK
jgi:prepilin-type N-terminal cleavage/methylation domain-containing protein